LALFISEKVTFPKAATIVLFLTGFATIAQAGHPVADVITLKNGDIHIGEIKQSSFALQTHFGLLRLSPQQLTRIDLLQGKNAGSGPARLSTLAGEQIYGELLQSDIKIDRLQDPEIPVDVQDIHYIEFGTPHQAAALAAFPALLQTRAGDKLYVRPAKSTIALTTDNGVVSLPYSQLRYLDSVLRTDEDAARAQATLRDGQIIQGQLLEALPLVSPYQPEIELARADISRLTLTPEDEPTGILELFSDAIPKLGIGPEMVVIPGGQYLKGDHQGDGDFDEQPLAETRIKGFAIGRYEVTFAQYDLFCRQTHCDRPDDQEWGRGDRPVMNVSWKEALAYTQWLSEKTGRPYRLPSDAEWEYAHRAGEMSRYAWGNEVEFARANCEGCGSLWDGDQTAPVGRFAANAFGLYDTAGNVFEWVADCFHDRFADAPSDGSPIEKPGCGKRVIRGGSWSFPPREIRSANRWRDFPSRRSDDTGFRVALDL